MIGRTIISLITEKIKVWNLGHIVKYDIEHNNPRLEQKYMTYKL